MPAAPKSILYLRPDTFGDLIIFSGALNLLLEEWPNAHHTLVVRPGYETLAPLFPSALHWEVSPINPYTDSPHAVRPVFEGLIERLSKLDPDLVVAPNLNRTWIETAVASRFPRARRVSLGDRAVDPHFAEVLKGEMGIGAKEAFSETVPVDEDRRDWENNHRLVEQLVGGARSARKPRLQVSLEAREAAQDVLHTAGLEPKKYVVVFPGGLGNVSIKAWPEAKFGELIVWLQANQPHPILVAGHASESETVENVVAHARSRGAHEPARWLGRDGEISLLAAILETSSFYVGHDTGAMHVAAAVGRPVVGIFGGGHWPRFRPVGPQSISVVQPLPCFGCNWDCVFGNAPCVKDIAAEDVERAIQLLLREVHAEIDTVVEANHFSAGARRLIDAASARHRVVQIHRVKTTAMLKELERAAENSRSLASELRAQSAAQNLQIENLNGLLAARTRELAEARVSHPSEANANHARDLTRLIAERDALIRSLRRDCAEREQVIRQLALNAAGSLGKIGKLGFATRAHARLRWWTPLGDWFFRRMVEGYWMQIGVLEQYSPRPLRWDRLPKAKSTAARLPAIGIVTPSYGQAQFIESTMVSVLDQKYSKLHYVVQDGGSKDESPQIIARYADRLSIWESTPDHGQSDAIQRGFKKLEKDLGPNDLMAWLNSDDLLAPGSLHYVADYFARHPKVDVVYGHRIIIDSEDRELGRWIMPRNDRETLTWHDFVPQETLFWRKRVWDRVGGIDSAFQFALDWDLLSRFQTTGARMKRLPYFLGCFRVHAEQKTARHIHTTGEEEMRRIRTRFHGDAYNDPAAHERFFRKARLGGAIAARLLKLGIRF